MLSPRGWGRRRGRGGLKIDGRRKPPVRCGGRERAACRAEAAWESRASRRVWLRWCAKSVDRMEGYEGEVGVVLWSKVRRADCEERKVWVWEGLVQPLRRCQSRMTLSLVPTRPLPSVAGAISADAPAASAA